jgi:hypothetical protein
MLIIATEFARAVELRERHAVQVNTVRSAVIDGIKK